MKIALVDLNADHFEKFKRIVGGYYDRQNILAEIDFYNDPGEFVNNSYAANGYNMVFIDLVLTDNGKTDEKCMMYIRKIRKTNPFLPIIFINWINDRLMECIHIFAERFVLDPYNEVSFSSMMSTVSGHTMHSLSESVNIITLDKENRVIQVKDIVYAEVENHTLKVKLYSGEIVEINCSMQNFSKMLSNYPEFISPHRSYIVNVIYISNLSSRSVSLKNDPVNIPVAKGKYNELKQAYKDFFSKYHIMPYPNEWMAIDIE